MGGALIFEKETIGLPGEWIERWSDWTVYVPMPGKIISHHLANTASIILAQASLKAGLFDE